MYDEVMRARNDGLSLAFFSGDTMWHEIEFYDSSVTGAPCRAFARKANEVNTNMPISFSTAGMLVFTSFAFVEEDVRRGHAGPERRAEPGLLLRRHHVARNRVLR